MYQDDYLFFPEAQVVDKLLSVFNIQSQQQLEPNTVVTILGLLNLLNIVSVMQGQKGLSNQLTSLVDNSNNYLESNNQASNLQQIQQLVDNVQNNNNSNTGNIGDLLSNLLQQDNKQTAGPLNNILGMLGNSNSDGKLDPALLLKLMNLISQIKDSKKESSESKVQETNQPVKSEPYNSEEGGEEKE
ncbi:hypothetical protein [Natroniella sp. ANB-PHB2]|uniref:hypothetical protein n=1 Tax=Natroniella sp. ANB-PHB2 TaxID=3384444 RepID=UPI0038D4242B